MSVLVDTSVWSLALRRSRTPLPAPQERLRSELATLVADGRVVIVGPIRQELLSGIREAAAFETVRARLAAFEDEPLESADFEQAARIHNACRARGIAGSTVDFLLCAVAERRQLSLFTTDRDFTRYARVVSLQLHAP